METEGSLPCSQNPATPPYPDSVKVRPILKCYTSKIHLNIIHHAQSLSSSHPCAVSN